MIFGGENAESYYDEGLTASMKGDLDFAVQCFEKALRLDRNLVAALHQLAKCSLRLAQAERAVDLLTQVVRLRPKMMVARLDLGAALNAAGRSDQARACFTEVLDKERTNKSALLGLAQVAFDMGEWAGAVQHAQDALAVGGPNFVALYILGRAARLTGDEELSRSSLKEADALLERSIELNPDQPESYFLRGEVNLNLGQLNTALDLFCCAAERLDERRRVAFGEVFSCLDALAKQGVCLQRLGRAERAREIGEEVLRKDPSHRLAQSLVGAAPGADSP